MRAAVLAESLATCRLQSETFPRSDLFGSAFPSNVLNYMKTFASPKTPQHLRSSTFTPHQRPLNLIQPTLPPYQLFLFLFPFP
ncbi:hypothetical protein CROQUDRAFT_650863 [Cronartium quercuum f. sp. fusiforme G11]|uniref:Uncharacterized protein n=1 Tax=Cronartium quercuum f. sp. fusiforme G11 TaxID=708437 RepID=A0A9P6TGI3_9BASI|nr:hypothetical protein CROQUDRAFT_650863 [Cronartium quercuum f. sp. fusiforme G11]